MSDGCGLHSSTVAISAYNELAQRGPVEDLDALLVRLRSSWLAVLSRAELVEAVRELQRRRLLIVAGGRLDVMDPQRRIIVGRDRDHDPWQGWRVVRPQPRPQLLSEVLAP